jgi:hypothetical protein
VSHLALHIFGLAPVSTIHVVLEVGSHGSRCEGIAAVCDALVPAFTAVGSIVDMTNSFITQDFVAFSLT